MTSINATAVKPILAPSDPRFDANMYELTGRTIHRLLISDDQSILEIQTDSGSLYYEAEGGGCSESWFADITGVQALLGGTCRLVEEIKLHDYNLEDGRSRQEEDQAYGYRITTDKGRADIVFRNSSNGYYGGWLRLCNESHGLPMKEITDDWSA